MRLFDSHAHLTDERFAADLDEALARATDAGVASITCIASDIDDSAHAIDLAHRVAGRPPRLCATAGIHPHNADAWTADSIERLEALAPRDGVVAIGETGLDFYYENAPRPAQIDAFQAQLDLAARLGLPVVVHSRDADADTASIIREHAERVVGVLHCFSGGTALLESALGVGWYVSFSGLVTFAKFDRYDDVRAVPSERLLIETDSPYLAPVPRRGRRNEPAYVAQIAARIAEIRGVSTEELAETTYRNACRFYGIEEVISGARNT